MSDFTKVDVRSRITRVNNVSDRKIISYKNQVYETIKSELLKSGRLFEDPLFLPSDRSMFSNQSVPSGARWKRPKEITPTPKFFVGNPNPNDLDQGYLG
jgi:hypothetical protein